MKLVVKLIPLILVSTIILCACGDSYDGRGLEDAPKGPKEADAQSTLVLANLEDLKILNLAANYLKDLGINASFYETLIEYHDANTPVTLELAGESSSEYTGEYLEVKFYYSDNSQEGPYDHCTTVYIDQKGQVIGHK
ncbi:MAG TPA: hypothetical protein VFD33_00280 [Bacillota bacterium]|nr:hypothetical protein [Bacillota bacterium]